MFVRDQSPAVASVMLTLQPGRTLSDAQVRAINHLAASSVPGLSPDNVSVVDQSGRLLSQQGSSADDRTFQLQLQIEDRYRHALTALLAPVVGPDGFTAEVHADLDMSESQSTRETYPKDDRALRREEGNKSNNSAASPSAIGIPGALSNQPPPATQIATTPAPGATASSIAGNGTSAETYTRSFDVGREISVTHQPTGRIRRLTVAVALRNEKGAKPRKAEDVAAIESLIKGAVGFDSARGDVVAVSARTFAETAQPVDKWTDSPWLFVFIRQGGALLAALLAFLFVGRPVMRALRNRVEANGERRVIEDQLLDVTGQRNSVTLDMIDAAPSYQARAELVRGFVKQDPARAALVVRQLMKGDANG
jgi:flagellar M-ring protein FliF